MLIAFLIMLGIDLVVIVLLVAAIVARKRWVRSQHGAFRGTIRVATGEVDGLRPTWHRGYARWLHDVLVWSKGPLLFRDQLVAADGLATVGSAEEGEISRFGDRPVVIGVTAGSCRIEVAAAGAERDRLLGPYRTPASSRPRDRTRDPGS